jgi:alpha-tubulin suppressor-like RCC1 family protein
MSRSGEKRRWGIARLAVGCAALATLGCSILVGDGSYAVGPADAGGTREGSADAIPDRPTGIAALSVASGMGPESFCAVAEGGDVYCWGDNTWGELGDGTTTSSRTPVKVVGLSQVTQVSVGAGTACALTTNEEVECWGYNQVGQLGEGGTVGTPLFSSKPGVVKGLDDVVSVSTGYVTSCAVKRDGTAWCWGYALNYYAAGGSTGPYAIPTPTQVPGITSAVSVSVGQDTACALLKGGTVACWGGYIGFGTLGDGTFEGSTTPKAVESLSGATLVSVGESSACALTAKGGVECWGDGELGQLGTGSMDEPGSAVPVAVMGLDEGYIAVAAGFASACAVRGVDGAVLCWGDDEDGQVGAGAAKLTAIAVFSPVQVLGVSSPAVSINAGGAATCITTSSGSVECWGLTADYTVTPVAVTQNLSNSLGVGSISVGGDADNTAFACMVAKVGFDECDPPEEKFECWGSNIFGELGDGSLTSSSTPQPIKAFSSFSTQGTRVSAGYEFACGVGGGAVQCWGVNNASQLGNQSDQNSQTAVPVTGLPATAPVVSVAAGESHACALTDKGAVYCWGADDVGQLGQGTTGETIAAAIPVPSLQRGVSALSAGDDFTCAALTNGTVQCWGNNNAGQLGTGTLLNSSKPAAIPQLSGVSSVCAGFGFACATSSGGVYCWGYGGDCQLGNGLCRSSSTPVAVSTLSGATQVACAGEVACAIVSGSVYCWGNGPLGNASVFPPNGAPTPVAVMGLGTGVTSVSVGASSACAIVHGAPMCWGSNSMGQLGNGGAVSDLIATRVAGFR